MGDQQRLHPADVEAIAHRSAELVLAALQADDAPARSPMLIDAATVAERFGVDRSWVYEHADDLGAVRLGDGARPRLRFDPDQVLAALSTRSAASVRRLSETPEVPPSPGRRRQRTRAEGARLLPIRDQAA
jgi:hypothetical protein